MGIEGADKDVQVAVVVGDLGFGSEPRIPVFFRLELPEPGDRLRDAPHRVLVPSVNHYRDGGSHGLCLGGAGRRRCDAAAGAGRRRGGLQEDREQDDSRHNGSSP